MRRDHFDAAAMTIRLETAGEWDVVPAEWLAGRVSHADLFYKGRKVTRIRCYGQTSAWMTEMLAMLWKACMNYADVEKAELLGYAA